MASLGGAGIGAECTGRPGRDRQYDAASGLGASEPHRYAGRMEDDEMAEVTAEVTAGGSGLDEADDGPGEEARRRLTEDRDRVAGLIDGLRVELGDTPENEEVGELAGYDQHPADLASETFEREKDLSILEGLESDLAEIEAALQRIDEGTWGTDEETGEAIDPARLDAYPAARTNIRSDRRR